LLRSRLVLEWVLVALFGMLVAASTAYFGLASRLDNLLLDVAAPLRAAAPDDRILIVEIDNDSLAAIGNWPWPRTVHAQFLNRLKAGKPRVIAYDVLFLEPGPDEDDLALAASVADGAPTLLPVLYQVPGFNGEAETLMLPVDPLRRAATSIGQVNLLFDGDGLVRRAQLQTDAAGRRLPHLMEQTYRQLYGQPSPAHQRLSAGAGENYDQSPLLPMHRVGTFRRISFDAVLKGQVPAAFLRDKIVLVGATADGMGDRYPVSALAGSSMGGIEIQANLLNALVTDRLINPSSRALVILFNVLPVLIIMLCFWRFRPTANLALSIAFIALVLIASAMALAFGGIWLPPAAALIGISLAYPLWGWRRLQALSGFLVQQSRALRAASDQAVDPLSPSRSLDQLGRQAAELEGVINDLNDRKRFVSDVIAGLPDAVCVLDEAGVVAMANPAARHLFGAASVGAAMSDLLATLGTPGASSGDEVTLPDGRSFLLKNVLFGDRPGSITMLAETTALRELGREREEMLEFLSHDMRAPQSAILMLIGDGLGIEATASARIADYAKRTLRLADDFVQLARLKAVALSSEEVHIGTTASEAIDMAWPQAKAREVRIIASGLDAEAFIMGDASALLRAIANLVDNAIKYGPARSEVEVRLRIDNDTAELTVSDQGSGLPLERAKDVFARFGDRGNVAFPGSGLGLAFVKAVVEKHKGSIGYETDAQHGTRFTIRLPLI
jgi:CHASE2 domain-containing sensor protein/two-component sensor histidine kinase